MNRTFHSTSEAETEAVAANLAKQLRGGELVELRSDLGGGKTTFTRGLVAGLGSTDPVASPTFTISREYTHGRLHVYHFDLYRLGETGIVGDELAEILGEPDAVVVVEWAGIAQNILPEERITIDITYTGETTRTLHIEYPESLQYIFEDKS